MLKYFNVSIYPSILFNNALICHLIFLLLLLSFFQGFENKASEFFLVKTQGV